MGYRTWLGCAATLGLVFAFGPKAPAAPVQSAFPWVVTFATAPAPVDVWNAPWTINPPTPAGSVSWTLETTGGAADGSGNTGYYRGVRLAEGSSVPVLRYPVPAATDLYVGCWIRCPNYDHTPGENFWVEVGALAGTPTLPVTVGTVTVNTIGQHFDEPGTGGAWTVFKKFEGIAAPGPNHDNGNVWTWYSTPTPINTGANTVLNLAFKLGSLYDTTTYARPPYNPPTNVLDVGYDGLTVSDLPLTVPPGAGTFNPPPGGGSGGGGTGGGGGGGGGVPGGSNGDNDNGDASFNDKCHCAVPASGRWATAWLALALALGLAFLRRR